MTSGVSGASADSELGDSDDDDSGAVDEEAVVSCCVGGEEEDSAASVLSTAGAAAVDSSSLTSLAGTEVSEAGVVCDGCVDVFQGTSTRSFTASSAAETHRSVENEWVRTYRNSDCREDLRFRSDPEKLSVL